MSDLIRFTVARRDLRSTQHSSWLDGGSLMIYDAPAAADGDEALTTQIALVTFTLADPFGTVLNGVLTADAIDAALIAESGIAAWARVYDSLAVPIGDYSVGGVGSGEAIELDNLNLVQGAYASILSFVVTEG